MDGGNGRLKEPVHGSTNMEKVTPLDLERAQLPRGLRGYRPEAVDRLLLTASQQLEAQIIEIRRLNALLKSTEAELERFRAQESTLNSALVLAQKTGDETRASARKEAELILDEAHLQAKEIRRSAQESVRAMTWEAERLQAARDGFSSRFRALLQEHLSRLDSEAPTHAVLEVDSQEAATG